jgi:hypothetical protein
MALELDHVFVLTRPGAPEAAPLADAGLAEGAPNTHPGQGTACRRFFFDGAYLELLWISDRAEALGEPAAALRLLSRSEGGCPFGVCVRASEGATLPFATRPYVPAYLPPGTALPVATASDDPRVPLVFASPFSAPSGGRALARVLLRGPWRSSALRRALEGVARLEIAEAPEWSLEVVLAGGVAPLDLLGAPVRVVV